jgi:hypothetical protein
MSESTGPKVVLTAETREMGKAYLVKQGMSDADAEARVAEVENDLENQEALLTKLGATEAEITMFSQDENASLQEDAKA